MTFDPNLGSLGVDFTRAHWGHKNLPGNKGNTPGNSHFEAQKHGGFGLDDIPFGTWVIFKVNQPLIFRAVEALVGEVFGGCCLVVFIMQLVAPKDQKSTHTNPVGDLFSSFC